MIIQYDNNTIPNTRERASSSVVDVDCTNPVVLFTIRLRIRMFVFHLSKCISLKRISYDWDIAERVSKEITERSKSYSPERALLLIHSVKNIRYSTKNSKSKFQCILNKYHPSCNFGLPSQKTKLLSNFSNEGYKVRNDNSESVWECVCVSDSVYVPLRAFPQNTCVNKIMWEMYFCDYLRLITRSIKKAILITGVCVHVNSK